MAENGSPAPEFETGEDRTYFLIRLPIHAGAAPKTGTKSAPSRHQLERGSTGEVTPHVTPPMLPPKSDVSFVYAKATY